MLVFCSINAQNRRLQCEPRSQHPEKKKKDTEINSNIFQYDGKAWRRRREATGESGHQLSAEGPERRGEAGRGGFHADSHRLSSTVIWLISLPTWPQVGFLFAIISNA